jgi:hypothetical protein
VTLRQADLGTATLNAIGELRSSSITAIQWSTAVTWAGRAIASFQLFEEAGDLSRLLDAEDYMHEALEHAALTGDESLLRTLAGPMTTARDRAHALARTLASAGHLSFG